MAIKVFSYWGKRDPETGETPLRICIKQGRKRIELTPATALWLAMNLMGATREAILYAEVGEYLGEKIKESLSPDETATLAKLALEFGEWYEARRGKRKEII